MPQKEGTNEATTGFKWMVFIATVGLLFLLVPALLANIYFVYLMCFSDSLRVMSISSATLLEVVATVAAVLTVITVVFSFIMLARAQEARDQIQTVRESASDAIKHIKEQFPTTATTNYAEGRDAFSKGDYGRAIFFLDQAIMRDEVFWEAYVLRGEAWYNLKEYDNAIKNYDKVIGNTVNDALPFTLKGEALLQLNRNQDARVCFEKALEQTRNFQRAKDGLKKLEKP
jgi:tetratricopeptide (TPR) repeat protein